MLRPILIGIACALLVVSGQAADLTCHRILEFVPRPKIHELLETSLNSVCSNLNKDDQQYLFNLRLCVCVIFKEESNKLIWLSLGSADLDVLNSVLKANNFNSGNPTRLIDYAYGLHSDSHPPSLVLKQVYDYLISSIRYYSKNNLSVMGTALKASGFVGDLDAASVKVRRQILRGYLRRVCQPLIDDKLLAAVWSVVEHFGRLTGSHYFSRQVLLSTDDEPTLRNMLIQRGFCQSAHRLDFDDSQEQPPHSSAIKVIKPDE